MPRTKVAGRRIHRKTDKRAVIAAARRQPDFNLQTGADASLWEDKDVVLAAVGSNGRNLAYAASGLKADPEVVSAAVISDGRALRYCSEDFKSDRTVATAAVTSKGTALQWCSRDLTNDRDIVRLAVAQSGAALEFASERFKNDKETVLTALRVGNNMETLRISHFILACASEELRGDLDVVMAAIYHCGGLSLMHASEELRGNRDLVLAAVDNAGGSLEYASPTLRADKEVVMNAVRKNGMALEFISEELQADQELALAALRASDRHGNVLQFASKELRSDREFVLQAVTIAGFSLRYASIALQGDREVVETALLHSNGIKTSAIMKHASKELRADRQLIRSAIEKDSKALHLASEELQLDPDIVALAWDTMDEDHDLDLWCEFEGSELRSCYIKQASALQGGVKACNKLRHFQLDNPHLTVQFADGWLAESLEKKWLMGEILRTVGISPELGISVDAYAGIQEDINVASKLVRFCSVLCHTKKGMEHHYAAVIWNAFVTDARQMVDSGTEE